MTTTMTTTYIEQRLILVTNTPVVVVTVAGVEYR